MATKGLDCSEHCSAVGSMNSHWFSSQASWAPWLSGCSGVHVSQASKSEQEHNFQIAS